jgi:hypothetical protein
MKESILPSEFAELNVNYVQRKSPYEFSSSCPQCFGAPHDGELPDRFIMLMPEKSKAGIPFGWCRKCNYKWWAGQKDNRTIDPATLALLQAQAKAAEERRLEERRRKLKEFSTSELWEELHLRMGEEQRKWWRANGIPDEWQDYLRLGYTEDKIYKKGNELLHSPAYTIPYFGLNFVFKTLQYRLINASPSDRYRFETDLGTSFYMTTPNVKLTDSVIICEGAKKAMVVRILGGDNTVLAVPSKSDWKSCGILEEVKNCGRVYVMFDPDCYEPEDTKGWIPQPVLFAKAIGKNARVVECSVKIDDAFLLYGMTVEEWKALKKQAVKL